MSDNEFEENEKINIYEETDLDNLEGEMLTKIDVLFSLYTELKKYVNENGLPLYNNDLAKSLTLNL